MFSYDEKFFRPSFGFSSQCTDSSESNAAQFSYQFGDFPGHIIPRTHLVRKALAHLDSKRVLFVHSPPLSGKTAFGDQITKYVNQKKQYECTNVNLNAGKDETFEDYWLKSTKKSWSDFLENSKTSAITQLIVMDGSCKNIDPKMEVFWHFVELLSKEDIYNIQIVVLSIQMHPKITANFDNSYFWSLDNLLFSSAEMDVYCWSLFRRLRQHMEAEDIAALMDCVKYFTQGYAGCLYDIADYFYGETRWVMQCYKRSYYESHARYLHKMLFEKSHYNLNKHFWIVNENIESYKEMISQVANGQVIHDVHSDGAKLLCEFGVFKVIIPEGSLPQLAFTCPLVEKACCKSRRY